MKTINLFPSIHKTEQNYLADFDGMPKYISDKKYHFQNKKNQTAIEIFNQQRTVNSKFFLSSMNSFHSIISKKAEKEI